MAEWAIYDGLNTLLGAPACEFDVPARFTRKITRSMGRVSLLAAVASEAAVLEAGLMDDPLLKSGRVGIAYGSSSGSVDAIKEFASMLRDHSLDDLNATTYIRFMTHTAAVNLGLLYEVQGRIIPISSACTSGSQSIGYAFEAIRSGSQDVMLAGGAEELSAASAAVFDTLFATSTRNGSPETTPRPFDRDRDGLVVGEGACTLVLEEFEHARKRGATVLAEISGFATNSDGRHVTQPSRTTMQKVMELALEDAGVSAGEVGYVNAHGTATATGDIEESSATLAVFGSQTPVSSLKGHMGHTLGACGAIEAWACIEMMRSGRFAPTANLDTPDPACAALDYIRGPERIIDTRCVVSNNFAFGGINTSMVLKAAHDQFSRP
jgi:3-oxoacyl-[acyl-carrier-protein] synthase II